MKRFWMVAVVVCVWMCAATCFAERAGAQAKPDDPEAAAITATALDYIEGWYTGDAARMEKALHPELAKRIVLTNPQNKRSRLDSMGAMTLVQGTRRGGGKDTPKERQQKDVTILDRYENVAVVKVVAADFVDYLSVAKFNGEWKIINVLWEYKPEFLQRQQGR